tara:strand:+ start:10013 stop:10252 length:240 start_codon:yes stop_codon:yes gene_type:complete
MLKVSKPQKEPEREIFDLDRSDRKQECKPPRKIRVRFFDMISECLRGKGYVEMEISDEEDAFEDNEKDFGKINIKNEDI